MRRPVLWTLRAVEAALVNWRQLLRSDGRLLIIDGIWWDTGDAPTPRAGDDHPRDDFSTEDVVAELYVHRLSRVEEVADLLRNAGLVEVESVDLASIDDAEGHLESVRRRYALAACCALPVTSIAS